MMRSFSKRILVLVWPAAVAFLFLGVDHPVQAAGSLYSEEVSTSRTVSGGYLADRSLFFLASYGLYRAPVGIARFPDGGRPRFLFHETYLYRFDLDSEELEQLMVVWVGREPGLDVKNSYFEVNGRTLFVVFKKGHGNRQTPEAWHAVGWDMRSDRPVAPEIVEKDTLLARFTYDGGRRWGIADTRARVDGKPLGEWRLPSPLDYMNRSDAAYADDLVALRGDQPYRNAVIEAIAEGAVIADVNSVLRRIEERKRSLEEPQRGLYELYVAETKRGLEAIRD